MPSRSGSPILDYAASQIPLDEQQRVVRCTASHIATAIRAGRDG